METPSLKCSMPGRNSRSIEGRLKLNDLKGPLLPKLFCDSVILMMIRGNGQKGEYLSCKIFPITITSVLL